MCIEYKKAICLAGKEQEGWIALHDVGMLFKCGSISLQSTITLRAASSSPKNW